MEPSLPPLPETEPSPPTLQKTSLAARLINVFAMPGEVFGEVKASANSVANWLVPVIVASVVTAVAAFILFSQPAFQQQMREAQTKKIDQQVKAGKMTQAQADQALAIMDKFAGPTMMKIAAVPGALISSACRLFWWALVLWLLGRWLLKARFDYMKTLEVVGLAMMIGVLGTIVTVLLQVNLAKMFATPSLGLVLSDFDATRKSHLILGALNVFSIWQVAVLAAGLSRLASVPFLRASWVVFTYWVVQESALILIGLGQWAQ